jgi:hypothetical protein
MCQSLRSAPHFVGHTSSDTLSRTLRPTLSRTLRRPHFVPHFVGYTSSHTSSPTLRRTAPTCVGMQALRRWVKLIWWRNRGRMAKTAVGTSGRANFHASSSPAQHFRHTCIQLTQLAVLQSRASCANWLLLSAEGNRSGRARSPLPLSPHGTP